MKLSPMLKKFKDKGKLPLIIVAICSIVVLLAVVFLSLIIAAIIETAKPEKEAVAFDSYYAEEDSCSYIEPYIMSDSFGRGGNNTFYFVLTEDNYPYLVLMNRGELGKCQEIIDWTYDESGLMEHPGSVYIEGYPVEIDDKTEDLIVENFNYFWGEDIINEDNVYEYFGGYYLDATASNSAFDGVLVIIIPTLVLAILLVLIFAAKRGRCNYFNNATKKLNTGVDSLVKTDAEINANEAKYFAGMKVYFTSEHFVYVKEGLLAIPYSAIYNAQSVTVDKKTSSLNIVLKDGQQIMPINVFAKKPGYDELEAVTTELQSHIDVPVVENSQYNNTVNLEVPSENKIFGSLAAIIGALAGGIIFMVLWNVGYISSVSGMVGMMAAVFLYQKAAKNIGLYGYIYCMVVSIGVLFAAAILSYTIMISSELGEPFISVLTNLFTYMSDYSLWGGFWIDFLFGAGFSLIWFLARVFKR